jgi:hypothetical protein
MTIDLHIDRRVDEAYGILVDPFNLDAQYERIELGDDCVLQSDYFSTEKVMGSFTPLWLPDFSRRILRIYYKTTLGSETQTYKLETMFMDRKDIKFSEGAKTRSVDLHSANWRYTNLGSISGSTHPAKERMLSYIEADMTQYLSTPKQFYIAPGVNTNKTFGKEVVLKKDDSHFTLYNVIADLLGCGSVDCDEHGRNVLKPYVTPAKRPIIWTFEDGANCQYEDEMTISPGSGSVPTHYFVRNGDNGQIYRAIIPQTSPYSYSRTGRIDHVIYEHKGLGNAAAYQAKANEYMNRALSFAITVEISHYFAPIRHGDVVRFIRKETGTDIRGMVYAMDRECSKPGIPTRTVLGVVGGGLGNVYP